MPKIVDHEAMRERILTRSFELFARKGFAAVTMRGIARESGVSTGSLYHYFETKEHLFRELVRLYATNDISAVVATLPPEADDATRLRAMFAFVTAAESQLQHFVLLVLDYVRHRGEPSDVVRDAIATYRDAIAEQLRDLDLAFGTLLLDVLFGLLVQRFLDPDAGTPGDRAALLERVLPMFRPA